jgi:hypothetical protein
LAGLDAGLGRDSEQLGAGEQLLPTEWSVPALSRYAY